MIINDDALGKLGINPTLFDEDQKRRISLYFDCIENGAASDSLYPSSESLDSECEAIRARCKNEDLHIKDLINKAKEDLNTILNACKRNINFFGDVKNEASLDDILFTSSFKIQEINETINQALDHVVTLYSSFVRLSEIRNEYRLLTVEASLVFYAERLHGLSEDLYLKAISRLEHSKNELVKLADSIYKTASSYERLLEFSFLTSIDKLAIALDFDHDGKGMIAKNVFEQLSVANNILTEAEKI